jgi:hypothetical protein
MARAKTGGRQKGTPNKTTALLKDAIITAATDAGPDGAGLVGYLKAQAVANPGPFMALLGKVLPMQIGGDPDNPVSVHQTIEQIIVDPTDRGSKGV